MSIGVKMKITGLGKIERLLRKYPEKAEHALEAELYLEAQGIQTAVTPLVPVDTGTLRNSWSIETPTLHMSGPTAGIQERPIPGEVILGYGGPAATYAWWVHEIPANHMVGSWKYLEIPFNQAKMGFANRVAVGMDKRLNVTV